MVLRPLEMSDVGALMDIFSDPEATRYHPGTKTIPPASLGLRDPLPSPPALAASVPAVP
jgi:hypothetical protein